MNHVGHFTLTGLLLGKIGDRVVTLSSIAHRHTPKLWINDLNYESRRYQRHLAYAQSKRSNLMFARELQRRLAETGSPKRSYAVHPGVLATELVTGPRRCWTGSPDRESGCGSPTGAGGVFHAGWPRRCLAPILGGVGEDDWAEVRHIRLARLTNGGGVHDQTKFSLCRGVAGRNVGSGSSGSPTLRPATLRGPQPVSSGPAA